MDAKEKTTWGGSRQGSGRKATGRKAIYKTVSISGTPEEIEQLKQLAEKSGKTFSRFIIESFIKE